MFSSSLQTTTTIVHGLCLGVDEGRGMRMGLWSNFSDNEDTVHGAEDAVWGRILLSDTWVKCEIRTQTEVVS